MEKKTYRINDMRARNTDASYYLQKNPEEFLQVPEKEKMELYGSTPS